MALGVLIAPLTAGVGAAVLRPRTWPTYALVAYTLLLAQLVAIIELLSLVDSVTAGWVIVLELAIACAVTVAVARRGLSLPDRPHVDIPRPLLVMAALVAIAILYEFALAVGTPPNNWDSMAYHLSRAAAWYQQHRVGYVDAHSQRENNSAPNAEILILFTFLFIHGDRLAAVWEWLAQIAAIASIYIIAGRLAVPRAARIFAALLFATMAQPALQASSTQNDLIAASLVGCGVAFLCTSEPWRYPVAAVALGLALGTKLTIALALPALLLIAIKLVPRGDRRRLLLFASAAFIALGVFGYVLNVVHTGVVQGNGAAIAKWSQHSWAGRARTTVKVPEALIRVINPIDQDTAYFGGLGALAIIPAILSGLRWRRSGWFTFEAALALAVPLFVLALAYNQTFNPFMGRFMLIPVVLTTPLAALLYRHRRYVAIIAAAGIVGLFFSMADSRFKPIGLFGHDSIWSVSRVQAQARTRPAMSPYLERLEAIPARARIGYSIGEDDWDYPLYGKQLERTLVRLPRGSELAAARRAGLRWVIVRNNRISDQPRDGWKVTKLGRSGIDLLQPA